MHKLSIEDAGLSERGQAILSESIQPQHFVDQSSYDSQSTARARLRAVDSEPAAPQFQMRVSGPAKSILALFDRWDISDSDAAVLLGKDAPSFLAELRRGTFPLTERDTKDRVKLLIQIYEATHSLMRDVDAERNWVRSPLPALERKSVLGIMLQGSILDLLHVLGFLNRANGR